jgi:hypothetical protein
MKGDDGGCCAMEVDDASTEAIVITSGVQRAIFIQ